MHSLFHRTPHLLALGIGLSAGLCVTACGRTSDEAATVEVSQESAPPSTVAAEAGVAVDPTKPRIYMLPSHDASGTIQVEPVDPTKVVLTVNGEALTQADFDVMMLRLIRRREPMEPVHMAALREQIRPRVERELIMDVLIAAEVAKEGLAPSQEEFEAHVREKEKSLAHGATIDSALASAGIERSVWERREKRRLAWKRLRDKKSCCQMISDAEARAYYDQQVLEFQRPETAQTRHVLVSLPKGAKEDVRKQKRAQIDDVRARLIESGGADFAKIAEEVSDCPTCKRGGILGEVRHGQTVAPFEKAVFGLKVGEISPVVETQFGYHVIQVQSRTPAGTTPFEEVVESIKHKLEDQGKEQALTAYMRALEASATIVRPDAETEAAAAEPAASVR